jgi:HD-like signal output (HDOD) protein
MGISLRRKKADGAAALKQILGDAEVPTFPAAVVKTLETLRAPDSSASDVADALSVDPGLTVRLLKLVNSAGFGPSRPVSSIDQAVAIAGFGAVESIVLSVGITGAIPAISVEGFDQSRFWMAASRRATTARAFAGVLHPATASFSFTAGLLQDMAIPMLAGARPDYRQVLVEWHEGGDELHILEREAFGWSHDEVGGLLCDQWDLPAGLRDAIAGHHQQDASEVPAAVRLVAPLREVEHQADIDAITAAAAGEYGIAPERSAELLEDAQVQAVEVAAMFT